MTTELMRRRLISTKHNNGQEILSIHRLLQNKILQELDRDPKKRDDVFHQAFLLVRKRFPRSSPIQVPDEKKWSDCKEALPHVLRLRRVFNESQRKNPPMNGSVEFTELLYDAGFNSWEREMTHDGLLLLETAENILNSLNYDMYAKLRGDIHAIAGIIRDNVGISKKKEGLEQREIALKIRQWAVDNSDGPPSREAETLLYNAKNDVAESLLQSYKYTRAADLINQCFEQYKKWGPETEYLFEYAKYYHNIGTVRLLQKRYDEAVINAQKAVDLTKRNSGKSQRYLFYLYDLACYVLQAGDKEKALQYHQEVMNLREEVCGEYNDVTLQSCYAVGAMYHHLGQLDKAEYEKHVFFKQRSLELNLH
jgi:tetratricopeptide (TPR) repeat protein